MRSIVFFTSLFIGLINILQASAQDFRCLTPEMNRIAIENNPQAQHERANLEAFTKEYIRANKNLKDEQIYVVPVVFHIVHNYGEENITYEQIEDAVNIMTDDFRLRNADTTDIIDEFKQIAGDSQIEFRLAKIDPWGNCTNGVTRTVSYETANGGEHIKDIAPSWPRDSYLNIWVVRSIPGGVAGYAYYPGSTGDGRDGILINHSYVGSIGTGSVGRSRTLTHETGHFFNLAHPWGSTNDPEVSTNCEIDDGIEDTPNTVGNTLCRLHNVSCGSLDNVQNHMDYAYCSNMFTKGQGLAMRAALNSSAGDRNMLWQEENLIETGVLYPDLAETCPPQADFSYDIFSACEGVTVQFTDLSYQTDTISSYEWNFPGGTPALSNEKNPSITYNNFGYHDVSLTVTNPADNSTKTISKAIQIYPETSGNPIPFFDNLESPDFPIISSYFSADYYFIRGGEIGWTHTDDAAYSGTYALMIDPSDEPQNIANSFVTPAIIVNTSNFPIEIEFKMAYSQKEVGNMDVLKVSASKDCGQSWILQYYIAGNSMHTANDYHSFYAFIPENDEWEDIQFTLNESLWGDAKNLRLKFEFVTKNGNRMYIDDISARQYNSISGQLIDYQIKTYPNPVENLLLLQSEKSENMSLELYDLTGRLVNKGEIYYRGETDISWLLPINETGLFLIKIRTENGTYITKIHKL
jgi:hypothetical protein